MGRIKELVTEVAMKIVDIREDVTFEEAMRYVTTTHDVAYWMAFNKMHDNIRQYICIHCADFYEESATYKMITDVLKDNLDYKENRIYVTAGTHDTFGNPAPAVHIFIRNEAISNPDILTKAFGPGWEKKFRVDNNYNFS